MPFTNPIVGGTALVRQAINSPNFAAGSAGWSINQNGTAEFNNATVRGEVDVGNAPPGTRIVITKNLPPPLNTYVFSTPSFGSFLADEALIAYIGTAPDNSYNFLAHITNGPGATASYWFMGQVLSGSVIEVAAGFAAGIAVGFDTVPDDFISLLTTNLVIGGYAGFLGVASMQVNGRLISFNPVQSTIATGGLNDFQIDGRTQPRGLVGRVDSIASTAAIGAEAVVATIATFPARQGRAYLIRWAGQLSWTAAATLTIRTRLTNLAGTVIDAATYVRTAAGQDPTNHWAYYQHTAADTTITIVQTLNASAGTASVNAAANAVRSFEVYDAGAGADFANAMAV